MSTEGEGGGLLKMFNKITIFSHIENWPDD